MKKNLIVVLFFLSLIRLPAADLFEGSYDMAISSDGEKVTLSVSTKDGNLLMKMPGADVPGEMILRAGMKKMLVIMHEQRMYMEMPLEAGINAPDEAPSEKEGTEEMPFRKTGRTKEIQGYTAHEFVIEDEGNKMEIWASEELGGMPFVNNPMMAGAAGPMKKLTGLSAFFPLEVNGYKGTKRNFQMRITRIEKKQLADSLFEAPGGYQKFSMPTGMGR
jgi:hypothetical protein